jgi:hypothetical protein
MSKIIPVFFNSQTLWLITELLIASLLCFIPIVWAYTLTEQTLSQGLLVATMFLVPSELYRQFKVDIDAYLAKHGVPITGHLSPFAKINFPIFHRLHPDLAMAYRGGHKGSADSKPSKTVILKLQCWKCGAEFPYSYTPEPLDKSGSVVLKVTKTCPMCHATCQLIVQKDQLHLRRFKTQAPE